MMGDGEVLELGLTAIFSLFEGGPVEVFAGTLVGIDASQSSNVSHDSSSLGAGGVGVAFACWLGVTEPNPPIGLFSEADIDDLWFAACCCLLG
jgi:hypothetical protein